MDVDATLATHPTDRHADWMSAVACLVFGVGLGVALAHLAPRIRARRGDQAGEEQGLHDLTRDELYERAQAADIQGRSGMSKDELIEALRADG
jgi:hypothetical protein